ncbi:U-box domain-containing protein 5-like [Neltuma alba]|uniref:U-box domain-containing protein 5-like n=1 Tax=Neltuma alba TaxID=207710 RepID=UPI0010A5454A|nr:U-box domain-containing protein 5-like isoform X2 [Prosopis alba]XP_028802984.1 U-box domain-containing protein 5-like [Prosopis alba]
MANTTDLPKAFDLSHPSQVKVHRSICLQLGKFTERISQIVLAVESARPNCALAVRALCSLHFTLDKAKSVIRQCSQSSKLYLAVMAHKIVSRCEKIRSDLELYLTQIQQVVPILLDAEISGTIHDLRAAEFSLEFAEEEARKALLELLKKDLPGSGFINDVELDAVQIATLSLKIASPIALSEEKAALKLQIDKAKDTGQREMELVKYLLYLLIKYRKFICQLQTRNQSEKQVRHHQSMDHKPDANDAMHQNQIG